MRLPELFPIRGCRGLLRCRALRCRFATCTAGLLWLMGVTTHVTGLASVSAAAMQSAVVEGSAGEGVAVAEKSADTVESLTSLARRVQQSIVLLKTATRDGNDQGLGTGFVIDSSGLVVTARHVIGDGRDISVELPNNRRARVTEVFASSGQLDLAIVRIDDHSLPPLQLGTREQIVQGLDVVTVGHPRGYRNSVVDGLISGRRSIDGISMLQLAMPVEPGNSGGPVVDRQGRVLGVVTMKSTASDNLGFAIPIDVLQDLLADPNPVPMSRWRTIGALDERLWKTLFGANWRQRAGRISVDGTGSGFGGRSLCIMQRELPVKDPQNPAFEWQAMVKLQDESGAAGLIFHSDQGDRHYGFYPSAGNLRLTRFDGPDVNSWTILHNEPHPEYRSGDWNTLKVRIEPQRFVCYLNDVEVVVSSDSVLPQGKVGVATFRGTAAEFRHLTLASRIPSIKPDQSTEQALKNAIADVTSTDVSPGETIEQLLEHPEYAGSFLEEEARRLERRAAQMRNLRNDLHQAQVLRELSGILHPEPTHPEPLRPESTRPESSAATTKTLPEPHVVPDPDGAAEAVAVSASDSAGSSGLLRAALLIARLDNEEVDVQAYVARVEQMAEEIRQIATPDADTAADTAADAADTGAADADNREAALLQAMDEYLFDQYGFRGSRFDYDSASNSYLNEVIDDREGLPITLSVLYLALAEQLGLPVVGVGLPGHFVVRYEPRTAGGDNDNMVADSILIDPFEKGMRLTAEQAMQRLQEAGFPAREEFLRSQTKAEIIERMLRNLLNLAEQNREDSSVLRYLEALVTVVPDSSEYRAKRLEMRARTGRLKLALEDADWFIRTMPEGTNHDRLMQLKAALEEQLRNRSQ